MLDVNKLVQDFPQVDQLIEGQPLFWQNPDYQQKAALPIGLANIFDAEARFQRFAKYFEVAFSETLPTKGILESPLIPIPDMQTAISRSQAQPLVGQLLLKADNLLPISGSIKSRGGIYEVLKFAEKIAVEAGILVYEDNYAILANSEFKELFSQYGIAVGSTGNLGLSIGIVAQKLGFQTTVHMSSDAAQWKKDLLRAKSAVVVEYDDNFSNAITAGRKQAAMDPKVYFIDDEGSVDLFLGYSVAALRLQGQLKAQGIKVDEEHPLFVYLPAGVGGSPGGVAFGLKEVFGKNVHPIFAEPTHIPSVTLGMMTGLNDQISVYDVGIDGITKADGLAVGRPSRIAGKFMKTLLLGSATFPDEQMMAELARLYQTEKIKVEPSAASGFAILKQCQEALASEYPLANSTHIVWSTGGAMVPSTDFARYLADGQAELGN